MIHPNRIIRPYRTVQTNDLSYDWYYKVCKGQSSDTKGVADRQFRKFGKNAMATVRHIIADTGGTKTKEIL